MGCWLRCCNRTSALMIQCRNIPSQYTIMNSQYDVALDCKLPCTSCLNLQGFQQYISSQVKGWKMNWCVVFCAWLKLAVGSGGAATPLLHDKLRVKNALSLYILQQNSSRKNRPNANTVRSFIKHVEGPGCFITLYDPEHNTFCACTVDD